MDKQIERTGIEKKFFEGCLEVINSLGYELYDLDYIQGSKTLRIFIMNNETQSAVIEDCIKVDRALDELLDEEWVPDEVLLEVSSPGLFRKLRSHNQFQSQMDQPIEVVIRGNLPEQEVSKKLLKEKKFNGVLKKLDEENIFLNINNEELRIPWDLIKKAQADPDWMSTN